MEEEVKKGLFGPECQNIQEIKVLYVDQFCIPHHTMRHPCLHHWKSDELINSVVKLLFLENIYI